ncbi:MAG: CCA tRNA nucleotidyltransferase [Bacillota bacterium]
MGDCASISLETIPPEVRVVLERLNKNSFMAYLVGGVVRDIIQGKEPRDYDIATSATPQQVRELFSKVIPTGEKHGTVTVLSGKLGIEVTTLRRDGTYSDRRHPDSVEFTGSLKEDLSRRDFTVNSLACDLEGIVYDFFGGVADIAVGVIRAVGDPGKRFKEDALRMMRAIRFACQTGFIIEERTLKSIRANRRLIAGVSAERIREELSGILVSNYPHKGMALIRSCGLLSYLLPELDPGPVNKLDDTGKGAFEYTLDLLINTPPNLNVRLAALLHTVAAHCLSPEGSGEKRYRRRREDYKEPVEEALNRLKYDRKTIRSVCLLAGERFSGNDFTQIKNVKKLMARVGTENIEDLFSLWRAVAMTSAGKEGCAGIESLKKAVDEITIKKIPIQVSDLAINGNDLKALGIRPGRRMGYILYRLLDIVLERPEMNKKEILIFIVRQYESVSQGTVP